MRKFCILVRMLTRVGERTLAVLALLAWASNVAAFEVRVEPRAPRPGDVVRVEVLGADNPARVSCRFRSKSYPLYAVGPGRMRALIGLEAVEEPGRSALEITRRRFLLPRETKTVNITIAAKEYGHREIRMSRKKAKDTYRFQAVRKELAERGVHVLAAGSDEVPGVYKDIREVMAAQQDLVEIVARFDPKIVRMCDDGSRAED